MEAHAHVQGQTILPGGGAEAAGGGTRAIPNTAATATATAAAIDASRQGSTGPDGPAPGAGSGFAYGPPVAILDFGGSRATGPGPGSGKTSNFPPGIPSAQVRRLVAFPKNSSGALPNFLVALSDRSVRWYAPRPLFQNGKHRGLKVVCRATWNIPTNLPNFSASSNDNNNNNNNSGTNDSNPGSNPNAADVNVAITALAVAGEDDHHEQAPTTAFVGTSNGFVWCFQVAQNSQVTFLHRLHEPSAVSTLLHANYFGSLSSDLNMALLSGDASGRLCRLWLPARPGHAGQPEKAELIAQVSAPIGALEFCELRGWLLVSTMERIFLLDGVLSQEPGQSASYSGQPRIVGTKPHKGDLFATFAPANFFGGGGEALLAPRPGGRLWVADAASGTVQSTLRFGRRTGAGGVGGESWASLGRLLLVPGRKALSWTRAPPSLSGDERLDQSSAASATAATSNNSNSNNNSSSNNNSIHPTTTIFLLDLEAVAIHHEWVVPEVLDVAPTNGNRVLLAHRDHVSVLLLETSPSIALEGIFSLGSWQLEPKAMRRQRFLRDVLKYVLQHKANLAITSSGGDLLDTLDVLIEAVQAEEEEEEEDRKVVTEFKSWICQLEDAALRAQHLSSSNGAPSDRIVPNLDIGILANFPVVEDLKLDLTPALPVASIVGLSTKNREFGDETAESGRENLGLAAESLTPEQILFGARMQADLLHLEFDDAACLAPRPPEAHRTNNEQKEQQQQQQQPQQHQAQQQQQQDQQDQQEHTHQTASHGAPPGGADAEYLSALLWLLGRALGEPEEEGEAGAAERDSEGQTPAVRTASAATPAAAAAVAAAAAAAATTRTPKLLAQSMAAPIARAICWLDRQRRQKTTAKCKVQEAGAATELGADDSPQDSQTPLGYVDLSTQLEDAFSNYLQDSGNARCARHQLKEDLQSVFQGRNVESLLPCFPSSQASIGQDFLDMVQGGVAYEPLLRAALSQLLLQRLAAVSPGPGLEDLLKTTLRVVLGGGCPLARSMLAERLCEDHMDSLSEDFFFGLGYPWPYLCWARRQAGVAGISVVETVLGMMKAWAPAPRGGSVRPTRGDRDFLEELCKLAGKRSNHFEETGHAPQTHQDLEGDSLHAILKLLLASLPGTPCSGLILALLDVAIETMSEEKYHEIFAVVGEAIRQGRLPCATAEAIAARALAPSAGGKVDLDWLDIIELEQPPVPRIPEAPAQSTANGNEQEPATTASSSSHLSRGAQGTWVQISPDGLVARHLDDTGEEMCGVIFSAAPLVPTKTGLYFEVELTEIRPEDCFDGLTLGVTATSPDTLDSDPPTIDHIPNSWAIGYDGQMWDSHSQFLTAVEWDPRTLEIGDVLGVLITRSEGEMILFHNGIAVCPGPREIPVDSEGPPLYAVVDLLGAARAVRWRPGAVPCVG